MKKNRIVAAMVLVLAGSWAVKGEAMEKSAVFAGGCFWCMQSEFDSQPGVIRTVAGYTGGHVVNPTYEQVATRTTGHYEALEVFYDDKKVSYSRLLEIFWSNIDPTDAQGQFADKGPEYRAAIFVANPEEQKLAEKSRDDVAKKLGQPVVTGIEARTVFYPAEEYHQQYYKKNPVRYGLYHHGSGREQRLEEIKAQESKGGSK